MTMTEKLDLLMSERGLSKAALSRAAGIPYMTIVNFYEKGTDNVKRSTLLKLSRFFNVTVDFLAVDEEMRRTHPFAAPLTASVIPDASKGTAAKLASKKAAAQADAPASDTMRRDAPLSSDAPEHERAPAAVSNGEAVPEQTQAVSAIQPERGTAAQSPVQSPASILDEPSALTRPRLAETLCGSSPLDPVNILGYDSIPPNVRCDFTMQFHGNSMSRMGVQDGDVVYIRTQDSVENHEVAAVILNSKLTLRRVYKNDQQVVLMAENPAFAPLVLHGDASVRIIGKAIAFIRPEESEELNHADL